MSRAQHRGARLTAAVLALPLLTAIADLIGVAGGWLVAVRVLGFNPVLYVRNTDAFLQAGDIVSGLIKAAVFGFIVALMGCYHGYHAAGGARGVGRGLARAIVGRPSLLFFDEPTSGLDPVTAAAINKLIVEQVRDLGCTAVTITHDMASARRIADEIAMLYDGRIIWRGSPSELDATCDPYVGQFVQGKPHAPQAYVR